jgi:hypothetical protein
MSDEMDDDVQIIPIIIDAHTTVDDDGVMHIRLSTAGGSVTLSLDPLKLGERGEDEFNVLMGGIDTMMGCFAEHWFNLVREAVTLHMQDLP